MQCKLAAVPFLVAIAAQNAAAKSFLHYDHHRELAVGSDKSSRLDLDAELEIELSTLKVKNGIETSAYFQLANASVQGQEVACINCNTDLFSKWVQTARGVREAGCQEAQSSIDGGKHPNSPGYKEWAKKHHVTDLLAVPCNFSQLNASDIKISIIKDWDLDALRPRLQTLWAQRRLIMGYGMNPLRQQMNFGEALTSLARNAPLVTPLECEKGDVPHCNAIFSGLRKTSSADKLNTMLVEMFGQEFLTEHRFRAEWDASEQRKHVQAVLTKLKTNFFFYYQKCLAHEADTAQCNPKAASQLLGQVACKKDDDELSDDCVYAELRLCTDCKDASSFFEYSRFHGPLALFETKRNRNAVMGQCEEFSRAGHAIFGLLGYEARYILDFTDHVWIEVRIPRGENGTWVHADPSEGVMDSPLMYETGWGKKLTMIFAFTPWKVEHVTAKYTKDYAATVMRRGIPDDKLGAVIEKVNNRLKYELPLDSWGYTVHSSSKDRTLREVALWQHFEAN